MNSIAPRKLRIVVLAAGLSSRLGSPKALARVRGRSLLGRTLCVLAPFAASKIIVVIPPRAARYRLETPAGTVVFVENPQRARGQSTSVHAGIKRARYSAAVLLLPVDLVHLQRRDIARLIARWLGARRRVIARRVRGEAGSPLILPRWLYRHALAVGGDQGLREWVRRLPRQAVSLATLASAQADVDSRADLQGARRRLRPWP